MSTIHLTLALVVLLVSAVAAAIYATAKALKQWSRGKPPINMTLSVRIGGPPARGQARLPAARSRPHRDA